MVEMADDARGYKSPERSLAYMEFYARWLDKAGMIFYEADVVRLEAIVESMSKSLRRLKNG